MAKKRKNVVSDVNYDNFDENMPAIAKKSRIVRKSINNSLIVDENTLYQIIKI